MHLRLDFDEVRGNQAQAFQCVFSFHSLSKSKDEIKIHILAWIHRNNDSSTRVENERRISNKKKVTLFYYTHNGQTKCLHEISVFSFLYLCRHQRGRFLILTRFSRVTVSPIVRCVCVVYFFFCRWLFGKCAKVQRQLTTFKNNRFHFYIKRATKERIIIQHKE